MVSYDSPRGGISVITEKAEVTTSYLLIQNADTGDSGKYICAPSNADVATVRVHVLNGECNIIWHAVEIIGYKKAQNYKNQIHLF